VKAINKMAFHGSALTSINIPNSVASIGKLAFGDNMYYWEYGNSGLISVNVDNNNPAYSSVDGVLFNKAQDTLIYYPWDRQDSAYTIPDKVKAIGERAFEYSRLTSVIFPNGVTSIGPNAFKDCRSLASVTIPNGMTSIGGGAFYDCRRLASVTIPNSVTSIGNSAFAGCYRLAYATIPNSVTSIGNSAFAGCALTSVAIPYLVTSIERNTFSGCALTSVTIPRNVTFIGCNAFNISKLNSVTCLNPVPPKMGPCHMAGDDGAFNKYTLRDSAALYVPAGSINAYRAADGWKRFKSINPIRR
jgi:hypothetical protein